MSIATVIELVADAVDAADDDTAYGDRYRLRGSISVLRIALDELEVRAQPDE